ncbi:MAG TPA: alpha/beta fold hydrolase [Nonomuraea sp.]|nr:alpha/beta fold hydrolase [Nonomuraea sp.]
MPTPASSSFERWFPGVPSHGTTPALLCLSGAGGGPGEFRAWTPALAGRVRVAAVALPGRERRVGEDPRLPLPELVAQLSDAATPLLAQPFALLGYSLGAMIMYEVARALPQHHRANLVHLFVGAQAAPSRPQTDCARSTDSDDTLIDYLRGLGGTPEEILRSRPFMRPYLACLRADLEIAERYRYTGPAGLECPLTLFSGRRDHTTTAADLSPWEQETRATFRHVELPGGHFSIRTDQEAILQEITEALT